MAGWINLDPKNLRNYDPNAKTEWDKAEEVAKSLQPESLDYSDLLSNQSNISDQQRARLLSILKRSQLPSFDSTAAQTTNTEAQGLMESMLSKYSGDNIFSNDVNAGASQTANRLTGIGNALRNAQLAYNAGNKDWSRKLNRNQDVFGNQLGMLRSGFQTQADIGAREGSSRIAEINRNAQVSRMEEEYRKRIEQLKAQAETERKRGNAAGWASILGTIGTLAGAIATGGMSVPLSLAITGGAGAAGSFLGKELGGY